LLVGFERRLFDAQPLRLDPFIKKALERVRAGLERLASAMSADYLADTLFGLLGAAQEDFVMVMALTSRAIASQEDPDFVLVFSDLSTLPRPPLLFLLGFLGLLGHRVFCVVVGEVFHLYYFPVTAPGEPPIPAIARTSSDRAFCLW